MPPVDRTICERCRAEVTAKALFCPMCGAPRATQASDPLIGTIIAERYLLRERIGQGGSGTIYRADHVALRRKVAVKILHHELSRDDLAVERFRREATTVGEIDNEHIVEVLDFGRAPDGRPFLAMELLDGETLQSALKRAGKLEVDEALDILTQVGEALMEAHATGYVHRDLRPGNIFLARRKGKRFVKVLDFGLSKLVERDGEAAAITMGMTFGDPCYMSPEQARGEAVDRRADIYALGIMAFEILTGQPPFIGERVFDVLTQHIESTPATPSALRPDVPEWLDAIVLRALAKQPDERFVTVHRFIEALREGQATGGVMSDEAARSMPAATPPPPAPRHRSEAHEVVAEAAAASGPAPSPSRRIAMPPMEEPAASEAWYVAGDDLTVSPEASATFETHRLGRRSSGTTFILLAVAAAGAVAAAVYFFFAGAQPPPEVAQGGEPPPHAEPAAPPVAATPPAPAPAPTPTPAATQPEPVAATAPQPPPAAPAQAPPPAPAPAAKRPTAKVAAARTVKSTEPPAKAQPSAKPQAPPVVDFRPKEAGAPAAPPPKAEPAPEADDPTDSSEAAPAPAPLRPPPPDRNPAQAEFYVKIGDRAVRDGDLDGAVDAYTKARGFDNTNADAIAGLGAVALKQGRPGDATVHLDAAARLAPGSARIQTLRGQAYLAAGKREEAAAAFEKALKLRPGDPAATSGYQEALGQAPKPASP